MGINSNEAQHSTFSQFSSVQLLSHVRLCNPMNHSMPGLPVHHQLLESTETHVLCVGDAIQPSHPLSSPSPPAPNPSQHQGLFQWVNSSHELAKILEFSALASVLPMNTQDWSPLFLFYFIFLTFDMIIFFNEILSQRRKKIPLLIHQESSFRSNRGLVYWRPSKFTVIYQL